MHLNAQTIVDQVRMPLREHSVSYQHAVNTNLTTTTTTNSIMSEIRSLVPGAWCSEPGDAHTQGLAHAHTHTQEYTHPHAHAHTHTGAFVS